jgi:hypothetical protein
VVWLKTWSVAFTRHIAKRITSSAATVQRMGVIAMRVE